jgi:hypothetical protein
MQIPSAGRISAEVLVTSKKNNAKYILKESTVRVTIRKMAAYGRIKIVDRVKPAKIISGTEAR